MQFINTTTGPHDYTTAAEAYAHFPNMEARYTVVWDTTTKMGINGVYSIGSYNPVSQERASFETQAELDVFLAANSITIPV